MAGKATPPCFGPTDPGIGPSEVALAPLAGETYMYRDVPSGKSKRVKLVDGGSEASARRAASKKAAYTISAALCRSTADSRLATYL